MKATKLTREKLEKIIEIQEKMLKQVRYDKICTKIVILSLFLNCISLSYTFTRKN